MIGLGGDNSDRHYRVVIGTLDTEGFDHRGQHQGGLGQGKLCADADSRTDAERQIGRAVGRRRTGEKTRRVEDFRLHPQPPMSVQRPRCDEYDCAGRHLDAAGVVGMLR